MTVHAVYTLPDGRTLPIDFTVDGTGRCEVAMTWQGERAELPEFGLLLPLRRELTGVSYLGLGPRETVADRTVGGKWAHGTIISGKILPRTARSIRRNAEAAPGYTAPK